MARVKKSRSAVIGAEEYVCQCPRCLTLETLWFRNGVLVPTIKFSQGEGGRIYHDCNRGSAKRCRLFPRGKYHPPLRVIVVIRRGVVVRRGQSWKLSVHFDSTKCIVRYTLEPELTNVADCYPYALGP